MELLLRREGEFVVTVNCAPGSNSRFGPSEANVVVTATPAPMAAPAAA